MMRLGVTLLSAALLFSSAAFGQQPKADEGRSAKSGGSQNAAQQMAHNFELMKKDLAAMKQDAKKVQDQAIKDYMEKNNQMWDDLLADQLHMRKILQDKAGPANAPKK